MELHKLTHELHQSSKRLSQGANEIFNSAKEKAEAEQKYRVALAKEIMRLKEEKMPATLINDVARGNCADLKYERDLAEVKWQASREALNSLQAQVSALQTILKYQESI